MTFIPEVEYQFAAISDLDHGRNQPSSLEQVDISSSSFSRVDCRPASTIQRRLAPTPMMKPDAA